MLKCQRICWHFNIYMQTTCFKAETIISQRVEHELTLKIWCLVVPSPESCLPRLRPRSATVGGVTFPSRSFGM